LVTTGQDEATRRGNPCGCPFGSASGAQGGRPRGAPLRRAALRTWHRLYAL